MLDFIRPLSETHHERLLRKLEHYGTLNWIRAFLTGKTKRVIVDRATSDPAPIVSRFPQGSILGPILFLAFINDIPLHITSKSRQFADDCVVYKEINTTDD